MSLPVWANVLWISSWCRETNGVTVQHRIPLQRNTLEIADKVGSSLAVTKAQHCVLGRKGNSFSGGPHCFCFVEVAYGAMIRMNVAPVLRHPCKHSSIAFLIWEKASFLFQLGFQLFREFQTEWRRRLKMRLGGSMEWTFRSRRFRWRVNNTRKAETSSIPFTYSQHHPTAVFSWRILSSVSQMQAVIWEFHTSKIKQ